MSILAQNVSRRRPGRVKRGPANASVRILASREVTSTAHRVPPRLVRRRGRPSRLSSPASLAALASHADLAEVLTVGMLVPCFTWVVQLGASAFALPPANRRALLGRPRPDLSDRVYRSLACGDRQLVLAACPALALCGKRPAQCGDHGCGSVSAVRSARNRRRLAAQLVPDHHREHDALRVVEQKLVVTSHQYANISPGSCVILIA